jgi:hypothetical protein
MFSDALFFIAVAGAAGFGIDRESGIGFDDTIRSERYVVVMAIPKRSTIYFDPEIHRASRLNASATDRSISDVVNNAVRRMLSEDASDLETFRKRRHEPSIDFAEVVLRMRRSGKR